MFILLRFRTSGYYYGARPSGRSPGGETRKLASVLQRASTKLCGSAKNSPLERQGVSVSRCGLTQYCHSSTALDKRTMRLARACLLLAAARAFAPVPPVAARTTRLHAQEEANVGTAVRNIAPWLLFVLVGPVPRPKLSPSRVDGVLDDTSPVNPRRAGAAHPELQGVRH